MASKKVPKYKHNIIFNAILPGFRGPWHGHISWGVRGVTTPPPYPGVWENWVSWLIKHIFRAKRIAQNPFRQSKKHQIWGHKAACLSGLVYAISGQILALPPPPPLPPSDLVRLWSWGFNCTGTNRLQGYLTWCCKILVIVVACHVS